MKSIPYWLDTAAPFEEAERGPAEGQVDVAVIGGGLTGLAAAAISFFMERFWPNMLWTL